MANPHDANDGNDGMLDHGQQGDDAAARELFDRYAARIWRLAEQQIAARYKPRFDGDDIVQSVFRTFLRRSRDGGDQVGPGESLWRLLSAIARNKVRRQVAHHLMQRRAANREVAADSQTGHTADANWIGSEPTADDTAALIEEVQAVLGSVSSREAEVFRLCVEGHSAPEIAQLTGCSRWTVRRVLERLGEELQRRLQ